MSHEEASPLHGHEKKKVDLSFDPIERLGLTSLQAEEKLNDPNIGYNELPVVKISAWYVFLLQFTGTMPYIIEVAAIISITASLGADYADFIILVAMLISNATLNFHEQMKAAASLAELTAKLETKVATLRDGVAHPLLTRELVPGDVILVIGGVAIPADVEWLEGDVLEIDTAGLTGESIPRKYPSPQYGKKILAGSINKSGEAYCIVRETGVRTEVGASSVEVMKDKTKAKISVFEQRVLDAVKIIIIVSLVDVLVIFLVQGLARGQFTLALVGGDFLTCLSIIVAAIPIALPIVMNVTMALGAGKMAREFDAVVTSLPALQDISSMTILCSDKTGTLTTAKITIHAESVWTAGDGFTKQDVALYAALASSRDKKEDPIDRSVIGHFDRVFGPTGINITNEYTRVRSVGFNPVYKRVVYEYTHPKHGRITIGKGLATKVLDTRDGGRDVDDAKDQWCCTNIEVLSDVVKKTDVDFSRAGYKTLGVAIKVNDGPWTYCGILPMLDPPRHDTAQTIKNLVDAGIKVKMITGDHLNIAIETARLIGMGKNIHPGEATRVPDQTTHELIWEADGFAQVLPRDKREVVMVLKNVFNQVVGMTGDGPNDAPALSAAQCGVAVDDSTDAAKNAASIILTSPGLSAIYSGVIESRRIFRKLKAYVTYRFAASIQIVLVLSILIYVSNCPITALFIIILALFNDLTMLPIAYDYQQAGSLPENPDVTKILTVSGGLGLMETGFSLLFAYAAGPSNLFYHPISIVANCDVPTQGSVWLQLFISTELLIFSARAPTYFWLSIAPAPALIASVLTGCIIASLMAGLSLTFGGLHIVDIVLIWVYCILCLFFMDVVKVGLFLWFNENTEVLPDFNDGSVSDKTTTGAKTAEKRDSEAATGVKIQDVHGESRNQAAAERLSEWAGNQRMSIVDPQLRESLNQRALSTGERKSQAKSRESFAANGKIGLTHSLAGSASDIRPSLVSAGKIRPHTPANATKYPKK